MNETFETNIKEANHTRSIKLLNHQYEILADTETKILGLIGGYG